MSTSSNTGCLNCRAENKRCLGIIPCVSCLQTNRTCVTSERQAQMTQQAINAYGPKAFFGRYVDRPGQYVIFTITNGSTYVVNLDMAFRPIGQPRYLGHESEVARAQSNANFTVDDLLNSARNFSGPF